ncbi:uncharacterized protein LOC142742645 [Rhinoderma darwinii]|uniref:uncharacterized protein LOC142662910 n=1 Tax=Rhinoderma darwinii TaxID=43563 RepID=UPI003F6705B1
MERVVNLRKFMAPTTTTNRKFLQFWQRLLYWSTSSTFFRQSERPKRTTRRAGRRWTRSRHQHTDEVPGRKNHLVVNLSSHSLTPTELSVLQKGLSFCPTAPCNTFILQQELNYFYRSLRLKTHFGLTDLSTSQQPRDVCSEISISNLGLRSKSNFAPPKIYHATESVIELVQRDIDVVLHDYNLGYYPHQKNLSTEERTSLRDLQHNREIIIKPADKGGAIVILDYNNYVSEINRQLTDSNTYLKIPRDPISDIRHKINSIIDHHLDINTIDHKTHKFLQNPFPITPVFYVLPKIHKSLINPPGRPIVASTDSISSPLAIFLEKILTPLIKKTKSFLLDTSHFLQIIKSLHQIEPTSLLITLDVNSLYTSITHQDGLAATSSLLDTTDMSMNSKSLCLELLELILNENYFLFGDNFYKQINGTAMGSNMAPPYANAYMAEFESTHIYTNPRFRDNAICWHRYIDDIFCIWKGTEQSAIDFVQEINTIREGLQFTLNLSSQEISFLDTLVKKNNTGHLVVDLYTKPTDRNGLLHFQSNHPYKTKTSLPKSQYKRISRIVTDETTRHTRLQEMTDKFKDRGYPSRILQQELHNTIQEDHTPCTTRNDTKLNRIPFVHTYHPLVPKFQQIIRKHWHHLSTAYPTILEFKSPAMMCLKRPPNFRDRLVRADIGSNTKLPRQTFLRPRHNGTFPCLHCSCCSNVIKGDRFQHPHTNKSFPIKGFYTCDTNFVVYLVKCPCGLIYVGETTQHIRDRITSHKSTIRCNKNWLPLPDHFSKANHQLSQFQFQIIEHVPQPRRGGNHIHLLKERESYWIHTLQTLSPRGLNREFDLMN